MKIVMFIIINVPKKVNDPILDSNGSRCRQCPLGRLSGREPVAWTRKTGNGDTCAFVADNQKRN